MAGQRVVAMPVQCCSLLVAAALIFLGTGFSFMNGWLPSGPMSQVAPNRMGPPPRSFSLSSPGSSQSSHEEIQWGKVMACVVSLMLTFFPVAATARDGRVSPPTCVAIIDAATNCPARPAVGAKKSAEVQLKSAQERLGSCREGSWESH